MPKRIILLLTVLLCFSPVFSATMGNEWKEFSLGDDGTHIRLFFENYKMKDGWTPVVLSMGKFDLLLWMDKDGNVSELRDIGSPVCVIDVAAHSLQKAGTTLAFEVDAQNNGRTRWILPPDSAAGKLAKKMVIRENGIDVCLGDMKLSFNHVSGDIHEFSPGLLRVQFHGTMLTAYRELVYEKEKGIFYSDYEWKNKLITEKNQPPAVNQKMISAIPPLERAALIALYKSTRGDRWACNEGWKTPPLDADGFALPGTEQNWLGITCDPVNSTVQKIDLQGIGLFGTLPSELGNLSNLQYLNLNLNRIQGVIPPGLGNLANLKSLHMELNELIGPLPPELGNLTKLEELYLPMNSIDGSIPPEIGNLENLQYLSFFMNRLEGSIPAEIGNLHHLIDMNLECNGLSGNLPPEVGNLVNLQNLSLPWNMISGYIPPDLGKLTNLQVFNLAINQISGQIPPELGNLVNLKEFYIAFNQLSGSIPPELGKLTNLKGIDFSMNQLSGPIPPELGNLVNLSGVYLGDNLLSGSIPPELGKLRNLQYLWLNGNQLSGSLPPELGNLTNLSVFNLYRNQLSGSIPPQLGNMVNLDYLRLDENQLSGSIPPELGNMAKLEMLGLNGNQLSGSIPPELAEIPVLRELWLNENQLSGNIPWQLGNSPALGLLFINSNKLTGDIPSSLTNLRYLDYIDFRWNGLYTNDSTLRTFLNRRQQGRNWESTQTIAPTNITAAVLSLTSIVVNWTPVIYTSGTGGYCVYYGTTPGGPYTYFGMTADKTASSLTVTGLKPAVTYYFVVKTRTYPHNYNENTVDSEYSAEASVFLPPIMLTSPNGGETWPIRTVQKITWESLGLTGKISLELWKADERFSVIAARFPVANGSYTWLAGNNSPGLIPPGNDYKIKIITEDGLYYDISSGSFSIVN